MKLVRGRIENLPDDARPRPKAGKADLSGQDRLSQKWRDYSALEIDPPICANVRRAAAFDGYAAAKPTSFDPEEGEYTPDRERLLLLHPNEIVFPAESRNRRLT
jgi:hypothetical protein